MPGWKTALVRVVLIDHATAEAAELVAANLRVRGRAVLVGEATLGMGLVHELLKMERGTLLKIEIGELLAADGKPFSGTGVIPDLSVPTTFAGTRSSDRDAEFAGELLERTEAIKEPIY
jgi:C-terminal processing protease CtpA/Prc